MSATLRWKPIKPEGTALPSALRYALEKNPAGVGRRVFNESSLAYLSGLRDADVDGAQQLMEAIDRYEEVEVWWEY